MSLTDQDLYAILARNQLVGTGRGPTKRQMAEDIYQLLAEVEELRVQVHFVEEGLTEAERQLVRHWKSTHATS